LEVENIEVLFLPPNTTSLIQPMDQGIIQAFKRHYARCMFDRIANVVEISQFGHIILQFFKIFFDLIKHIHHKQYISLIDLFYF
uniref:DDE-1 domain-containing protein n=1 Tax=Salvator merianae TaxID=96440 RepID=A0A8D0BZI8_SALMN